MNFKTSYLVFKLCLELKEINISKKLKNIRQFIAIFRKFKLILNLFVQYSQKINKYEINVCLNELRSVLIVYVHSKIFSLIFSTIKYKI